MDIEDVIRALIDQGLKRVWLYPAKDSSGAKLLQLLDEYGDELAWRWVSDGPRRWRIQMSSLPAHAVKPVAAIEFNLCDGGFHLGVLDANSAARPI